MTTTILALLRGINVGGTRKLPMAQLHAACLSLGWQNPQTYIQSGNLIVDAPGPANTAAGLLAQHLHASQGWAPEIIACTREAWRIYIAANPFADEAVDARILHLYVSKLPPHADAAHTLEVRATAGERARLAGGALWIDYGASGIARSRLTPASIDCACGSPATGRNFNTVQRLGEMLAARP